jgi:uncharacterized membrane protein
VLPSAITLKGSSTMATDTESAGKQALASLLTEADRLEFWRHYERWIFNASDADIVQLEFALKSFETIEVQSLVVRINAALADEAQRRRYPESLMAQLKEANWPAASANG